MTTPDLAPHNLSHVARRLIARYGAPMRLLRKAAPAYDPTDGTVAATETEIEVKGIAESIEARFVSGMVQSGDRLISIAGDALAKLPPAPGDRLRVDGLWHDIVRVETTASGAEPLLYRLLVRR